MYDALGNLDMGGSRAPVADVGTVDAWECSYNDSVTAVWTGECSSALGYVGGEDDSIGCSVEGVTWSFYTHSLTP